MQKANKSEKVSNAVGGVEKWGPIGGGINDPPTCEPRDRCSKRRAAPKTKDYDFLRQRQTADRESPKTEKRPRSADSKEGEKRPRSAERGKNPKEKNSCRAVDYPDGQKSRQHFALIIGTAAAKSARKKCRRDADVEGEQPRENLFPRCRLSGWKEEIILVRSAADEWRARLFIRSLPRGLRQHRGRNY